MWYNSFKIALFSQVQTPAICLESKVSKSSKIFLSQVKPSAFLSGSGRAGRWENMRTRLMFQYFAALQARLADSELRIERSRLDSRLWFGLLRCDFSARAAPFFLTLSLFYNHHATYPAPCQVGSMPVIAKQRESSIWGYGIASNGTRSRIFNVCWPYLMAQEQMYLRYSFWTRSILIKRGSSSIETNRTQSNVRYEFDCSKDFVRVRLC